MTSLQRHFGRSVLHFYFFLKKHFLFIIVSLLLYGFFLLARQGLSLLNQLQLRPTDLLGFFGESKEILQNHNGVTNFLLLGLRGEGNDSPDLTDSLILFSLNLPSKQLTQIGIPRDLWVPSLQDRINTAYHYGQEASPGSGIKLAEASILETLGQPVDYTVIVNFNLFKQVVDLVGGVDIQVSPGFTDAEYPLPGKEAALPISSRYETITFPEGLNHLNGETALKFVRSRHSVGSEGTDFARSLRQQQVISALKDIIFSKEFLTNQNKLNQLLSVVQSNLQTNIPPGLYPILARVGLDQVNRQIKTVVFGTVPDADGISVLYNPPTTQFKGKWILLPKDNNWKALKQYIANKLSTSP